MTESERAAEHLLREVAGAGFRIVTNGATYVSTLCPTCDAIVRGLIMYEGGRKRFKVLQPCPVCSDGSGSVEEEEGGGAVIMREPEPGPGVWSWKRTAFEVIPPSRPWRFLRAGLIGSFAGVAFASGSWWPVLLIGVLLLLPSGRHR